MGWLTVPLNERYFALFGAEQTSFMLAFERQSPCAAYWLWSKQLLWQEAGRVSNVFLQD